MIEIIKDGKKRFVIVCLNCDARYSYELNDIVGISVRCPCCGEFCPHYNRVKDESRTRKLQILDGQPTADVVEVVRCKDCACYVEMEGYEYKGRKAKYCMWHSHLRGENDYCSDGRRKSERSANDNN